MRGYKFAAFDAKDELQPTQDQLNTAESLVDALDLAQGMAVATHTIPPVTSATHTNNSTAVAFRGITMPGVAQQAVRTNTRTVLALS